VAYNGNREFLFEIYFVELMYIFCKGIHLELIGPTMPTVAKSVEVDYNSMGSVLAWRGTGYFTTTILGAILSNIVKKHSEGLLVCAFTLAGIGEIRSSFNNSSSIEFEYTYLFV